MKRELNAKKKVLQEIGDKANGKPAKRPPSSVSRVGGLSSSTSQ
jgi:hypothetical protein